MKAIVSDKNVCAGCGEKTGNVQYLVTVYRSTEMDVALTTPIVLCPDCYLLFTNTVNKTFEGKAGSKIGMVDCYDGDEFTVGRVDDGDPCDAAYSGERDRGMDIPGSRDSAVRDINANFQMNHLRCMHCDGNLRPIAIAPYDPCAPYCYDATKNRISVDTYICEKCGNIVGRKRLDK